MTESERVRDLLVTAGADVVPRADSPVIEIGRLVRKSRRRRVVLSSTIVAILVCLGITVPVLALRQGSGAPVQPASLGPKIVFAGPPPTGLLDQVQSFSCVRNSWCAFATGPVWPFTTQFAVRSNGSIVKMATAGALPRQLDITAMSCASETACMAVGSGRNDSASEPVSVAYVWDGSVWKKTSNHLAGGSLPKGQPFATGVACPSPTECVAAEGFYQPALEWNGRSWHYMTMPGANGANLFDVTCTSPTFCMGVGGSGASPGSADWQAAETFNGERWTLLPVAKLAKTLTAVSCSSPKSCMAIGVGNSPHIVEHWNGRSWTLLPVGALPQGSMVTLYSVSCVVLGRGPACLIGGNAASASGPGEYGSSQVGAASRPAMGKAFALLWNGSSWKSFEFRSAGFEGAFLETVTCQPGKSLSCMALDSEQTNGTSHHDYMVLSFNGRSWRPLAGAKQAPQK